LQCTGGKTSASADRICNDQPSGQEVDVQKRHAITVVGLALVATSCSGEKIAEKIAENRIEAEGGGDVDIDLDGGNFSVKTEDGEFSIQTDGDGNVSIQGGGENGDESFTIESENGETVIESEDGTAVFSQGSDLPDGFPSEIPLPDDLVVLYSQASSSDNGEAFSVVGTTAAAIDEVVADTVAGLESSGYEQLQQTTTPDGSMLMYDDSSHAVIVMVGTGSEGETTVTLNVSPSSG
jgi:hypothetical protein